MGRGVDLALTPVVFGFLGWIIDQVAGTSPVFTLLVGALGVGGTALKMKLGYDKQMTAFDGQAATRPRQVAPPPGAPPPPPPPPPPLSPPPPPPPLAGRPVTTGARRAPSRATPGPPPSPRSSATSSATASWSPRRLLVGLVGWGWAGLASVALALTLVLVNFAAAAALQAWAARISYGLVAGVALFGFLIRLALITAVVLLVGDQSWAAPVPLGVTLVAGHLGLLLWESRFVSASLAFPGLKPAPLKEHR